VREIKSSRLEKTALFIDGPNLYATAKTLGFEIDFKRLLREFQSQGYWMRAFYYTTVTEDAEYSSIRPLIDWLDYNGNCVVTKADRRRAASSGRCLSRHCRTAAEDRAGHDHAGRTGASSGSTRLVKNSCGR
jgi:uncharacterized LabA/DUF88 family protein